MMTMQDSLDPHVAGIGFSTFNDFVNHFYYVARKEKEKERDERERQRERERERERER